MTCPDEVFVLLRDERPHTTSFDREPLICIVTSNPDFTARNPDGSEPKARIVRYVLKDAVNL